MKFDIEQFNPVSPEDLKRRTELGGLQRDQQQKIIEEIKEQAEIENVSRFSELIDQETDKIHRRELEKALQIAKAIKEAGGLALVVGGYTRDTVLKKFGYDIKPKDIDIEVYGLEFEKLKAILETIDQIDVVGSAFGVIKLKNIHLDISIPRKDSKTGQGHRGFTIKGDPFMTIREAARRRDFTINALAMNPLTGEILDFYGGIEDIKNRRLRPTDEILFQDDSLRILRAAQFASRFNFELDEKIFEIARKIDLRDLPKERIGEEWMKLLLKSEAPSNGLEAAEKLGIIDQLHPELRGISTETKKFIDETSKFTKEIRFSDNERLIVLLTVLCRDLNKDQAENLLKFWSLNFDRVVKKVIAMVKERPSLKEAKKFSNADIRRLAVRLHPATVRLFILASRADYPEGDILLNQAEALKVADGKPEPIILGRDLVSLGMKPSKQIGEILSKLYEMQLEGQLDSYERGLELSKTMIQDIENNQIK